MRPGHDEALERDGFTIVEDALDASRCDELAYLVDESWMSALLLDRSHLDPDPGAVFIENVLRFSATFARCVTEPRVLDVVRPILDEGFHLSLLNARTVDPGAGNQALHDVARRRGHPFDSCTVIWCLDAFTSRNGATRVIPGSHLAWEGQSTFTPDDDHPDQVVLTAPRGAAIVFVSALIHSGTGNATDARRRSLQGQYVRASRPAHCDWRLLPVTVRRELSPIAASLMRLDMAGGGERTR